MSYFYFYEYLANLLPILQFQVGQSLLWLVAYFWHVTRPLLAFLMDPELKVKSCFKKPYDLVETAAAGGPKSQNLHPLKVMLSPEITAESDETNELTSLKNSNQENCNSSNFPSSPEEKDLSNQQQQIKFDIIKNLHKRSDLIEENHPDLQQPEKSSLHSTIIAV